jgi:hypothetical protein
MHSHWLLLTGLLLGTSVSLHAQGLRVNPTTAAARAALRPADLPASTIPRFATARITPGDTIARPHRSRAGPSGLGFLAGAAAGLLVAYVVDQTKSTGEGRLENYIAIPLALGAVTFMTVFVALGD